MRVIIVVGLMATATSSAFALPATPQTAPQPPSLLDTKQILLLTDEVIRKAVREAIAESTPTVVVNRDAGVLSAGTAHDRMSAAFEQAKVPDCLHGDALKHQPARLGPVNVVGPYSLPWVVAAALRGKCN